MSQFARTIQTPGGGASADARTPRARALPRPPDNNFTPLRLLLAWLVFMGHFKLLAGVALPAFPFSYADVAVNGFFVVSGFLITTSYDCDAKLARFFIRRAFRLYPLYAAVLLLQIAITVAILHGGWPRGLLRYGFFNAIFLNHLSPDPGGVMAALPVPAINPSLWTLKIEVGFYLILPFLWMLVRRRGSWLLAAIFVLSVVYSETLRHLGRPELAKQLPGQMQFFVLGVALYRYRDRLPPANPLPWGAAILAGLAVVTFAKHVPVINPLATAVLVFGLACRTPTLRLRRDISYGVYLMHGPVIQLALLSGWFRDDAVGFLGCALVTVGAAVVGERIVERPLIALGKYIANG